MTIDASVMSEEQQQVLESEGITVVGTASGDGKEIPPEYKKDEGIESA